MRPLSHLLKELLIIFIFSLLISGYAFPLKYKSLLLNWYSLYHLRIIKRTGDSSSIPALNLRCVAQIPYSRASHITNWACSAFQSPRNAIMYISWYFGLLKVSISSCCFPKYFSNNSTNFEVLHSLCSGVMMELTLFFYLQIPVILMR